MYTWVYYMKAFAAILITNSHYGSIWPISALACGGLLGDVIYFAISGFCLYNIKDSLGIWYKKRINRIYPTVWIVSGLAVLIGYLQITGIESIIQYFVYPTYYHFVSSIMILYVLYYLVIQISKKYKITLKGLICGTIGIYFAVYIFVYDKSYYHIDVVEEKMILFVFFAAMLLGAWFREKIQSDNNKLNKRTICYTGVLLVVYFASKLVFSRFQILSVIQIFNTLFLLVLLYFLLKVSVSVEWDKIFQDTVIEQIIKFIAKITLEIYLVQYLVFYLVPELIFPINIIVVTGGIIGLAAVVNWLITKLREVKMRG